MKIWNRTLSCCTYYPSPTICSDPSIVGGVGIYSPDFQKDRGGNTVHHSPESIVSSLCISSLAKNVTISHQNVQRQGQQFYWGLASAHENIIIATLGSKGMMIPLGTETRPPVALRYNHIVFHQAFRGRKHEGCGDDWLTKYEYAAANFAECCEWDGWLGATEAFSLDDDDVEQIDPANGGLYNLPIGVWGGLNFGSREQRANLQEG
jgi:hypothetical protein